MNILKAMNLPIQKCVENLCLIGQTGAGKSTLLDRLATEILRNRRNRRRVGACFCTVKSDSPLDYVRTAIKAGRAKDTKVFTIGEDAFNPVQFILSRSWGSPQVVAETIEEMDEQQSRSSGAQEQGFWKANRRESMILATGICQLAEGDAITFEHIFKVLSSVPGSLESLNAPAWLESECRKTLVAAAANSRTAADNRMVKAAHDFFTIQQPMAGGKVIGATASHVAALIANFTRGKLFDTTCKPSTHTPLSDLSGGITIFSDTVSEGLGNQFFQLAYLRCLTREALARAMTDETPYCILFQDEFPECCAPRADARALAQGRSQRFGRVIAVQGVSTLLNAMDDGIKAKYQQQTILGNCITKVFLSNTDPETGELFEKLVGKTRKRLMGGGFSPQQPTHDYDFLGVTSGFNINYHEQVLPRKFASALTRLKTGGPANVFLVSFYLHQSGTLFENNLPFKKLTVRQDV